MPFALQKRLTGDPYIVHCVETAAIVECLHATSRLDEMDERWVDASVLCPGYAGPYLIRTCFWQHHPFRQCGMYCPVPDYQC